MSLLAMAGLITATMLSTSQAPQLQHRIAIEHQSAPYDVQYTGKTVIKTRQTGLSISTRPSTARCQWTASLIVERHISRDGKTSATALTKKVATDKALSGSRPGLCTNGRKAIEREVASKEAQIHTRMMAIIDADKAPLLADMEATHHLASNP